ncbi:MAG TPA: rhomboid family intramembrane serine protease [Ferruginibacter sp.]|nr:rhomboid family intramembrane serine protease [Ferruginibacter sp.]
MGEADRYQEYKIKKHRFTLGQPGNALMWLFALNIIFFLVLLVIRTAVSVNSNSGDAFYSDVLTWFQLPAGAGKLAERPWTILTYMFSDTAPAGRIIPFRLISNMLWLWAFGSVLQALTGNSKLIPVYLYGGFAGALFFIAVGNLTPASAGTVDNLWLLGANPAVMAVALAATMISPGYRFFSHINGGIPLWIITVVYTGIDLLAVSRLPIAYPLAHAGGALAGLLFVLLLKKKIDGSVWMNRFYHWGVNLFNPDKSRKNYSVKEKVFYNTGNRSPFHKTSNITQQRVDEILDKISQKGYSHLTREEKEILKKASEE